MNQEASEERPADQPEHGRSAWQFSLRTLLLLPVLVAAVCAVLFATPAPVAIRELATVNMILPAMLTAIIVYGKGFNRAFALGALFPTGLMFMSSFVALSYMYDISRVSGAGIEFEAFRTYCLKMYLIAVVSGLLCMAIRWNLEKKRPWGRFLLCIAVILLLFIGPIIGQVGRYNGWWDEKPVDGEDGTRTFEEVTADTQKEPDRSPTVPDDSGKIPERAK